MVKKSIQPLCCQHLREVPQTPNFNSTNNLCCKCTYIGRSGVINKNANIFYNTAKFVHVKYTVYVFS